MSTSYYSELWLTTRNDVQKLLELDEEIQKTELFENNDKSLNLFLQLYLKYRVIVRKLTTCHDQIIQVQKRNLIKQMLDCAIGRMLEYKHEIVNLKFTEYVWPDNFMVEMKLTPDDIALTTPAYYTSDRKVLLEQRKKYIEDLIANAKKPPELIEDTDNNQSNFNNINFFAKLKEQQKVSRPYLIKNTAKETDKMKKMSFEEAIFLIQCHERARAAHCRGIEAERQYHDKKKLMTGEIVLKKVEKKVRAKAVSTIQTVWRRYRTRKLIEQKTNRVEELLDMTMSSCRSRDILEKDVANYERRLGLQTLAVRRKKEAMNDERTRLMQIRGPDFVEDITDEIRNWFMVWYNKLGFFDTYPTAETGGSVLVATGQTLTPEEYLFETSKKKESNKNIDKMQRKMKIENKKLKLTNSTAFIGLHEANKEFLRNWSFRDESGNLHEREYKDLVKDELCYELQLKIRSNVDEFMRLELEKLNAALKKDFIASKGNMKIPKPKKAKRPKRQKKKKAKKDQLADYAVEDLFNQLVLANVIKNYPRVRLHDWIGDLSYQNYEAQRESREYHHRLGEIRQLVMEYCVLPLGSKEAHQVAPLVRSVNISGLPNYGKKLLVHAICSEIGATLFDLTPEVLADKYLGKKEQQKLINMVEKLSRIYAPSIIFIDGGEKPWLKRVPAELKYAQPKRFASLLPKLVKGIKPGDQILFLTISSEPYNATGGFIKIHDKFIIIPVTDYNTLYVFYKDLLIKYHNVDRNLDVSCLARLSVGLPLEFIRETIKKIMILRRRITLKFKPLRQNEIIEHLLEYDKYDVRSIEKFKKFEKRTPLERKRKKMIAAEKINQKEEIAKNIKK